MGAARRLARPRPAPAPRWHTLAWALALAVPATLLSAPSGRTGAAAARAILDARSAPVQRVAVPWGFVGYRALGAGPPLLLLIGGGGDAAASLDDWPPDLLDDLARSHRVVAMDYEGVGLTSSRPGPLSIGRLADDTADFVAALGLGHPDVLGWSMGGFVAQALAVRHPGLVRSLVLCASAAGNGRAHFSAVSGTERYPGEWLFPAGPSNRSRAEAYERSVHSYPSYYEGPLEVADQEGTAIALWLAGEVPEGHRATSLRLPVLVGDGARDLLTPSPDSTELAQLLRARLVLYPDAGHGFLAQHPADWAGRVLRFLAPGCRAYPLGPCS